MRGANPNQFVKLNRGNRASERVYASRIDLRRSRKCRPRPLKCQTHEGMR